MDKHTRVNISAESDSEYAGGENINVYSTKKAKRKDKYNSRESLRRVSSGSLFSTGSSRTCCYVLLAVVVVVVIALFVCTGYILLYVKKHMHVCDQVSTAL